jgi:NADH:ubiquinone oxidoreductase subunit 6 (subunit J)
LLAKRGGSAFFAAMDFLQFVLATLAVGTLGSALVALFLKNIIHTSLLLTVSWFGIAAFYLWAGAEFAAFAQALVYVGAVSIIVLFAVLLTRRVAAENRPPDAAKFAPEFPVFGVLAAAAVASVLIAAILTTPLPVSTAAEATAPVLTVKQIGLRLISNHVGVLLITGVLLTVALLGAVVIAAPEQSPKPADKK